MSRFIGVDLAWGEGSETKRANETGLAVIDERGTSLDAGWARGIDEVFAWLDATAQPGTVIAIDAPLVIPNATGMRLAERQVGMAYGNRKVAANASNQSMGRQGGVALRHRLEAAGFVYTSGLLPPDPHARTFFECYPYTTLVAMPELGYELERPRYKRLDKSLPASLGRQLRATACDELIRRMAALASADPPLDMSSHAVGRQLIETPSPVEQISYKHREDVLDAMLCAWTASIWHRHGLARVQILGEDDEPDADGRIATIVAPARREQRVKGRAMRRTRPRERTGSATQDTSLLASAGAGRSPGRPALGMRSTGTTRSIGPVCRSQYSREK